MKKSLVVLALFAAFAANAQDSNSTSNSAAGSNSGSTSTSGAQAIGNQNASQSASGSQSGASSGSLSGAVGNAITLNQNTPAEQRINSTANATSTSNNVSTLNGNTSSNNHNVDEVKYSGSTTSNVVNSGTSTQNVNYSGTQTLKNVPGIAMSGPASGPCTGVSGGLSAAGPGFGIGLNGSAVMDDCRMRENTRVLGMAMQSVDGTAYPQERGELTVIFMDAVRGLAAYNSQIVNSTTKQDRK